MTPAEAHTDQPRANALFRWLFVPAALALAASPWLSLQSGRLELAEVTRPEATALGIGLFLFAIWMAEQLFPARRSWNVRLISDGPTGLFKLGRDLFYVFGVTQATQWLVGAVEPWLRQASAAAAVPRLWPAHAPFAVRVAGAFLLMELSSYWFHRAAHRFQLLWQFHSTHHAATELNGFKALRTHPVDNVLFYVVRMVPLLILGAGPAEISAAVYAAAVLGILSHANVCVESRGLGALINFPAFHAVHHSAELDESRSNFGCHTVLFDRIFRTFRREPRGALTLGIDRQGERSLWAELVLPFYRWITPAERPAEIEAPAESTEAPPAG